MFNALTFRRTPRIGRRTFLRTTAVASLSSLVGGPLKASAGQERQVTAALKATGSDVGSLFPFIQSQAVKGEFPLSFLNPRFRSARRWRKAARGKLLELLHYAPTVCH